jgi:F-box protein 1 (cyclin F)
VLARVGFADDWPTDKTMPLYQRAAREGNFEANMKLGVACLYGEGCSAAPALASEMLMRAEQLAGPNDPFSWLLYRPPWSSDTCSKALIFKDMLALVDEHQGLVSKRYSGIMYCVAKTLWYAYSRHSCCPCLPLLLNPQSLLVPDS